MFTSKSHTMHVIAIQISAIENQPTLWSLYDANRVECSFLWLYMFKAAPRAGSALEFMRANASYAWKVFTHRCPTIQWFVFFIHYFIDICWADLVGETFNTVCESKRWMTDKLSFTFSEREVPVKSKLIIFFFFFWIHLKHCIYFQ